MKYDINLIGEKKTTSFVDNLISFFVDYLRYVLVITQLVVIGVFFFRFSIDQSIVDLKESIDQKEEILKTVQPLLVEAKNVDLQLSESQKILQNQAQFSGDFLYLLSVFPESISLNKLSVENSLFVLMGTALNPQDLQAFNARLKREARFATVNLKDIQRDQGGFLFTLELKEK